jgi:hypothetical protein
MYSLYARVCVPKARRGEARGGEGRGRTEGQRRREERRGGEGRETKDTRTPTAHITHASKSTSRFMVRVPPAAGRCRCCRCCWIPARTHRARHAAERTNQIPAHTRGRARTHTSPPPSLPLRPFLVCVRVLSRCCCCWGLRASWPCLASLCLCHCLCLCLCPLLSAPLAERSSAGKTSRSPTRPNHTNTRTNAHRQQQQQTASRASDLGLSSTREQCQREQQTKGGSEERLKSARGSGIAHGYEQLL